MSLLMKKQAELEKKHPHIAKASEEKKAKAIEEEKKINEKGFCEKHGEFNLYYRFPTSGKLFGPIDCPECADIERERLRQEVIDRDKAALVRERMAASMVPKRYAGKKISDIDCEYHKEKKDNDTAKLTVRTVSKYLDTFRDRFSLGTSGFFSGECGTGKTMIACIAIESVISAGYSGMYTTAWNLIQDIRSSYSSNENTREIIKKYVRIDFLVIDEVGVQGGTNDERVLLYQVIDGRYNEMKPCLLISNSKNPVEDGFLDARTIDRLKENGGFSICLGGESFRGKR